MNTWKRWVLPALFVFVVGVNWHMGGVQMIRSIEAAGGMHTDNGTILFIRNAEN